MSAPTSEGKPKPLTEQFKAEIDALLVAHRMTRSDLARALDVNRSMVTQTLGGNATLGTVERFGAVFGVGFRLVRVPVKCATAGTIDPASIEVYAVENEGRGDGDGGPDRG